MVIYRTKELSVFDSIRKIRRKQIFIAKYDTEYPEFILPSRLTSFIVKYGNSGE